MTIHTGLKGKSLYKMWWLKELSKLRIPLFSNAILNQCLGLFLNHHYVISSSKFSCLSWRMGFIKPMLLIFFGFTNYKINKHFIKHQQYCPILLVWRKDSNRRSSCNLKPKCLCFFCIVSPCTERTG